LTAVSGRGGAHLVHLLELEVGLFRGAGPEEGEAGLLPAPAPVQPAGGFGHEAAAAEAQTRERCGGAAAAQSAACADRLDGSSNPSLDSEVYALFPTASLATLQLTDLPDELGKTLSGLTVESTLTVTAAGASNIFNLASPAPEAEFASGVSQAGQLQISTATRPHGFKLELGSAARLTFAASSLAPRLGVDATSVSAFIEAMVNMATRDESGTVLHGCDALDSLLCAEVEQAPGCVRAACLAGLKALAQRLDSSFSALDGRDLDFFLYGSAPIVDRDGDGHADTLGSTSYILGGPGLWSALFRSRSGNAPIYGSWTAERTAVPSQ